MRKRLLTMLTALLSMGLYAQVGIGTEDPKASLDIVAKKGITADGLLIPRLTVKEVKAMESKITTEQNSLLIYITDITGKPTTAKYTDIDAVGYYYYNADNSKWKKLGNATTYTAGTGINISGSTISGNYQGTNGVNVSGSTISGNYQGAKGIDVSGNTISLPTGNNGEVLKWNGSKWVGATIPTPKNYTAGAGIQIGSGTISATGLEKLNEGGNTGWRLIGRDPDKYGNIGSNAVDLSTQNHTLTTTGATGEYSLAMGLGVKASGSGATAMGWGTTASGYASTAMGIHTTASDEFSTAMGWGTTAPYEYSTAMGAYNATPTGALLMVGNGLWNNRKNALTVYKNGDIEAKKIYTTDGGTATKVVVVDPDGKLQSIDKSTLGGNYTAGAGIQIGSGTISATSLERSVVTPTVVRSTFYNDYYAWSLIGRDEQVYKILGFGDPQYLPLGYGAVDLSHGEESGTASPTGASGMFSFASGWGTTASGTYSIAMGYKTTASGAYSTAIGIFSTASGRNSTAMGSGSTASGGSSTAMGDNTIAPYRYSTAMGMYNATPTNALLMVGNGTNSSNRKNALTVYKDGTIEAKAIRTTNGGSSDKIVTVDSSGKLKSIDKNSLAGNNYTASNGVRLNGNNLELGGSLTKNTTIYSGSNLNFSGGGNVIIGGNQYLGVGTPLNTAPDARFHVKGTVKMEGLGTVTSDPYVLTQDSNGNVHKSRNTNTKLVSWSEVRVTSSRTKYTGTRGVWTKSGGYWSYTGDVVILAQYDAGTGYLWDNGGSRGGLNVYASGCTWASGIKDAYTYFSPYRMDGSKPWVGPVNDRTYGSSTSGKSGYVRGLMVRENPAGTAPTNTFYGMPSIEEDITYLAVPAYQLWFYDE